MLTRTFQARNMAEAMQMVKAELGPDAMIISSSRERRKGIFGILARPVFRITAAADPIQPARGFSSRVEDDRDQTTRDEFRKAMIEPLARELRELRERVDSLMGRDNLQPRKGAESSATAAAGRGDAVCPSSGTSETDGKEFAPYDLRGLLPRAADTGVGSQAGGLAVHPGRPAANGAESSASRNSEPGPLSRISGVLHEAGVGEPAIRKLMEKVMASGGPTGKDDDLTGRFREAIEAATRCSGPIRLKKDGTKIVALVGPTGVGKTTTIAKLAAHYTVSRKARVALVTTDTFRVGAVEQLKTYSRIMGVPLEVASTRQELEKALASHQDKDLILIDTVGRSPRDHEMLEGLRAMLDSSFAIETHLCVAATTRERELRAIVESFGGLGATRLLVTKLDESSSFGAIVNLQTEKKLSLSYFTRGQKVPEDIEAASGRKVAELILGAA